EADAMLTDLQLEAGSLVGDRLALPQLAAIARMARKLGIGVARPAIVAARDHDLELWVRAEPEGKDVVITIESWRRRPPLGPRLEIAARSEDVLPAPKDEWATDAELRITELSSDLAAILGASVGEAIGQPLTKWLRLVEGDDGAMPLLGAVAARTGFSGQLASGRNGQGQRLILNGNPVTGADGSFDGFRGRAKTENIARPEAANEAGNAGMTIDPALDHALRSPLARIIEAAEGIADRADGPLRSDYATYAGDISAAAKHLLSVIRAMVDQPPDADSSVDLSPLVDEAIGLVQSKAESRSVEIAREGLEMIAAAGEPRAIVQILVNLLGNAIRHAPDGSLVSVVLASGDDYASVTVADQGKGIDAADQERIFGKFERVGDGGGDAGLGLAIARRLANSMAGDVTLVSAPGEGARFTLSLPLA
ncbi:MAG TPA: HAMP domain-containing sensor histidine kinase, partial [Sphingomicrobium sp.]|nr:HAMP domain-containing sensor histidine kinase [Sphingomicrobium sp.]